MPTRRYAFASRQAAQERRRRLKTRQVSLAAQHLAQRIRFGPLPEAGKLKSPMTANVLITFSPALTELLRPLKHQP
jgi:hypothetical protein